MQHVRVLFKLDVLSWVGKRGSFSRDVAFTLFAQLLLVLLHTGNTAILAHWLGPEGKGMLDVALLVPGMLGLLVTGGLGIANVYYAGSRRLTAETLVANSVAICIVATALGYALAGILIVSGLLTSWLVNVPLWLIGLALLSLPINLLTGYLATILQGQQRIAAVNTIALILGVATVFFSLVLVVICQLGLLGAVLAAVAANVVYLLASWGQLGQPARSLVPRWEPSVMRSTMSFGLRGHVANLFQFFNYRLDMFLVNYFLGAAEVGIYGVAVRMAELLWHLPNAASFVLFPKAAAARAEEINAFTPRVVRYTLGLSALGALGLALLGPWLIQLVFSTAFSAAYFPMLWLLPGVVLLGGAKILINEMAGRGFPQYNALSAGIGFVATVALDVLLIPRWGISGAALASTIAYALVFGVALALYLWIRRRSSLSADPAR